MLKENLKINKQARKVFNFTLVDEDGVAIDITGGTITMTVKKLRKDSPGDALISKAGVLGATLTDGKFTVELTATESNQNPGTYFYDVVVVLSSERNVAAQGRFTVENAINIPTT